jgi:hypothetical protein
MSFEPIQVLASVLDALQVDLIGLSGPLGDHREVLPQAPSYWYLTEFVVPTDADGDQRYDPISDDEVDQAPAVATVDENQTPEQAASNSFSQSCSVAATSPSVATLSSKRQSLDKTTPIFKKSINAGDDLASCREGVTDAKPGLVSIA